MKGLLKKIAWQVQRIKWIIKNFRLINQHVFLVNRISSHKAERPSYNSDGLVLFNSSACLEEPRFKNAYKESLRVNDWRGKEGEFFDMRWRYYIVCYFANKVKHLEGDFAECGVYKGGYAMAIMEYLGFSSLNKKMWLFDTYNGLALDHLSAQEKESGLFTKYSNYEECYEWVCKIFQHYPVEIIKGTVPETLPQCNAEKICYLSIDMNCTSPEIAAAHFFWDKVVPGGIIMLDDYGFIGHEEQHHAFNEFAREKKVQVLQLPTGQGVIFKPHY
jgi:O-methyltransferase